MRVVFEVSTTSTFDIFQSQVPLFCQFGLVFPQSLDLLLHLGYLGSLHCILLFIGQLHMDGNTKQVRQRRYLPFDEPLSSKLESWSSAIWSLRSCSVFLASSLASRSWSLVASRVPRWGTNFSRVAVFASFLRWILCTTNLSLFKQSGWQDDWSCV